MIRNRALLRSVVAFFLLSIVLDVFAPAVSWALTAGPTAPEASSFEPVDTTDIVNLSTGDFVYNIPLLEVPGPAGGYPLSLSYHAGIQPNEDASWVGLGWTLNPGAINRSVYGYADDTYNAVGATRKFWEGGTTTAMSIGANVSLAGMPPMTANLSYSADTYQGVAMGGAVSVGNLYHEWSNTNGKSVSSTGIKASIPIGEIAALNVSASTNGGFAADATQTAFGGISMLEGITSTGTLISTLKSSAKQAVMSKLPITGSISTSTQNHITTKGFSFAVKIPIPQGTVNLAGAYKRYKMDDTDNAVIMGSLYLPGAADNRADRAYDMYDLPFTPGENVTGYDKEDPYYAGGTFSDYDRYSVSAQGLGGTIRPYHYKSFLARQERNSGDQLIARTFNLQKNNKPAQFRFEGELSNRHTFENTNLTAGTNPLEYDETANKFPTPGASYTGIDGTDTGYDATDNELTGSKHVQWFSNGEINDPEAISPKDKGFINCNALGFDRTVESPTAIGGFTIINETGVKYHYALPVFSYQEYSYSGRVDYRSRQHFNQFKNPARSAYTWLLTSVTGTDFVDRNNNGFADEGDWGYWVNFEYGKWSKNFGWRNPAAGFNRDIDREFKSASKGAKEVYYLNAVRTATHTAIFVKEIRRDGKGVVSTYPEIVRTDQGDNEVSYLDEGGYEFDVPGKTPTSTLALSRILIYRNQDVTWQNLEARGTTYNDGVDQHTGNFVIDVHDIEDNGTEGFKSQLIEKSIKGINFGYSYELCKGTLNSFYTTYDLERPLEAGDAGPIGKLTLTSLEFLGKKGVGSVLPKTTFGYDLKDEPVDVKLSYNNTFRTGREYTIDGYQFARLKDKLTPGDVVTFEQEGKSFTGLVVSTASDSRIRMIGGAAPLTTKPVQNFRRTKNPSYQSQFYDNWGFYKSDYKGHPHYPDNVLDWSELADGSENGARATTEISAKSVDAWCLRTVNTAVGAEINIDYEVDRYKSAFKKLDNIDIKRIERHTNNNEVKLYLFTTPSDYFTLGREIDINYIYRRHGTSDDDLKAKCNNNDMDDFYAWTTHVATQHDIYTVLEVGPDYIVVEDSDLYRHFGTTTTVGVLPNLELEEVNQGLPEYQMEAAELLVGQIATSASTNIAGGGIRVNRIAVTNMDATSITNYAYEDGMTSYEPFGMNEHLNRIPEDAYSCMVDKENEKLAEFRDEYTNKAFGNLKYLMAASRELPAPGVFYGKVTVKGAMGHGFNNEAFSMPGSSVYEFETYTANLVNIVNGPGGDPVTSGVNQNIGGLQVVDVTQGDARVDDFASRVGNLKKVSYFDSGGKLMSATSTTYLHEGLENDQYDDNDQYKDLLRSKFGDIGVLKETTVDARYLLKENSTTDYDVLGVVSIKAHYPTIAISQTTKDYKTGVTSVSYTDAFDFYTGEPSKTRSQDAYGTWIVTESIPAYRVYPSMGPAYKGGKNMLLQNAASLTYIATFNSLTGKWDPSAMLASGVQTWTDATTVLGSPNGAAPQTGIWRERASYSWLGNAQATTELFAYSQFQPYNFGSGSNTQWQKNGEVTLYDVNSHALEASDLNNNKSATKLSADFTMVYATAAGASYNEFAYSGAEDEPINGSFGGGVAVGSGGQRLFFEGAGVSANVHTGNYAVQVTTGNKGFTYLFDGKGTEKYRVSVWANSPSGQIKYKIENGAEQTINVNETMKAGEWYLLEAIIDVGGPKGTTKLVEVWVAATSPSNFDDFRIQPISSAMASFVYNKYGELTHILDGNNFYTEYKYDNGGRLIEVWKESIQFQRQQVSKNVYHYAKQGN